MNEITDPSVIRTAFVFGLLEGWWLSTHFSNSYSFYISANPSGSESYRKFGPCVGTQQWHELFIQTGFSGLDISLPDYDNPESYENSVLVTSAVEGTSESSEPSGKIEVVYDPCEPEQVQLAQSLAGRQSDVILASINQYQECFSGSASLRVFLLELVQPVLSDIKPELFEKLQRLLCSTVDVLWVSSGGESSSPSPHMSLSDGLLRVLMSEDDRKSCHLLSLQENTSPDHMRNQVTKLINLLPLPGKESLDTEYREQQGLLHIGRLMSSSQLNKHIAIQTTPKQHKIQGFKSAGVPLHLDALSSGLVPGFKFIEDPIATQPLGPDEIEIEVKCAGVNFRDVLIAVGQLNSPHTGFECSGIVSRTGNACSRFKVGDPVAALQGGCFANFIRLKETAGVVKIGPGVSFAEAAAVPVNFATAYIALHDVARMRAGESILIHAGAGGTGQAAIQLAQNMGVTVFATVGSDEKRQFLKDVYGIPESHIFSSRSTLFAEAVKTRTNGRGVDAVFNSLAGESLKASWECIAPYGRFLEIGIKDILANDTLPMRQFLHNVSFSAINLATMMGDRPEMCAAALSSVYAMLEQGKLRPAQYLQVYGIGEMERAFRSMQSGKHIGKIVIEMRDDDQVMV